jgi:hypothetical protein
MSGEREGENVLQCSICAALSIWLWISAQETVVTARSEARLVRYTLKIGYWVKQRKGQGQGRRGKETKHNYLKKTDLC